jgi:HEAT repeat protein
MDVSGGKGYEQRDNKGQIYNADKIIQIIINNPDSGKPQESVIINWVELCNAILQHQRQSQGLRHKATEKGFEVNVYVPLGLVERKEQPRRNIDDKAEMAAVYQLEKEVISHIYEHDEFLQQVIGKTSTGRNNHVAIIGEPGAGKTTLLGTVASFVLKANPSDLAIFISLASLQGRTLEDYVLKTWLVEAMELVLDIELTPEIKNQLEHQLKQRFKQGGVWLLLDGVDEMGFDSSAKALNTIQKQLTSWLNHARVALTCRLNVWDASLNNPLSGFDTYKTQDFEPEDIDKFIKAWFVCAELPQRGEQLQAKLKEAGKERICELVRNPLRLSLLCQIFYLNKQAELPKTKAGLYERFVDYFYEWKHPDVENPEELNSALEKLALAGINSNARFRLSESLAKEKMGKEQFKLACNLGWLNLVNRDAETDKPVYAFFHPTFQEYFAACAIEDWDFFLPREHINKPVKVSQKVNDRNNVILSETECREESHHHVTNRDPSIYKPYRIFEPQWKEVILLWLGRENVDKQQKEKFLNALVGFKDGCNDFYVYKAYFLVAVGIVEFKDYSEADKIVKQIIRWICQHPIEKEVKTIIQQTERSIAINTLVDLMANSQDEYTRRQAAESLGEIGKDNPIVINTLVDLMANSQDEYTRRQATESLGKIGKDNLIVINTLVDLIANSQDKHTRRVAAKSLGKIDKGNPIAIDALVYLITNSQDEYTRRQAAKSLGEIGKNNLIAINTLIELIANSQDESTLRVAAKSLGEIDKDNPIAIDALAELITNSHDEDTLWQSSFSLGKIGKDNPVAINVLVDLIATSHDEDTLWQAAVSLGEIGKDNPVAINVLVDLIATSHDEDTRRVSAESLGKIDKSNPIAINTLVDLITNSQDEFTCRLASMSLRQIQKNNPVAISALVNLIANSRIGMTYWQAIKILWNYTRNTHYPAYYEAWQQGQSGIFK